MIRREVFAVEAENMEAAIEFVKEDLIAEARVLGRVGGFRTVVSVKPAPFGPNNIVAVVEA